MEQRQPPRQWFSAACLVAMGMSTFFFSSHAPFLWHRDLSFLLHVRQHKHGRHPPTQQGDLCIKYRKNHDQTDVSFSDFTHTPASHTPCCAGKMCHAPCFLAASSPMQLRTPSPSPYALRMDAHMLHSRRHLLQGLPLIQWRSATSATC